MIIGDPHGPGCTCARCSSIAGHPVQTVRQQLHSARQLQERAKAIAADAREAARIRAETQASQHASIERALAREADEFSAWASSGDGRTFEEWKEGRVRTSEPNVSHALATILPGGVTYYT